jgi:hypothetical protein
MKGKFNWHCYRDQKPADGLFVYAVDPTNSNDKIDVGRVSEFIWGDNTMWCYVYIPDAPDRNKLEACTDLKGCSNNYILALEERIEILEKQMRNLE